MAELSGNQQVHNRAVGSIANAFTSMSKQSQDLPTRFLTLKRELSHKTGRAILGGWKRLLDNLAADRPADWGQQMIPEVPLSAIQTNHGQLP